MMAGTVDWTALLWDLGLIVFGAGAAWVKLRLHDKQLNGLGRKATKAIIVQIVWEEDRQKRWELARFHFGN